MGPLAIALLATLASLLYLYFQKRYSYWKSRKIVSLPVLPVIGSYREVLKLKRPLGVILKDVYDKYPNEKFVGGFKGPVPELIVFDPDLVRAILVKDFNHFIDRGIFINDKQILDQHLFNVSGEKWRILRQKLTPTFTSAKMKHMFHLLVECCNTLDNYVSTTREKSDVLEVRELMSKYTTDAIGSCAFGLRMNTMSDHDETFRKVGKKIFEPSSYKLLMRILGDIMPGILQIANYNSKGSLEDFFVRLVKDIIASRKTPSNRHDFIDLMMDLKTKTITVDKSDKMIQSVQEKEDAVEINDEVITAQAFVFFAAGFETSSTTMSYALRELALNQGIQDKLFTEIETVLKKHDGILTYDAVQEMDYLDNIIDETLRLYPPGAILVRKCSTKYQIPNTDIVLDEGVRVVIPVYALHHDPKYFPNPEEFQPERFTKGSEKTYHNAVYLPFGDGPRNCIGLRFGKLQSATGLASMIRKYRFEKCEETPIKIRFEPASFVLSSADGLWLKVTPRS